MFGKTLEIRCSLSQSCWTRYAGVRPCCFALWCCRWRFPSPACLCRRVCLARLLLFADFLLSLFTRPFGLPPFPQLVPSIMLSLQILPSMFSLSFEFLPRFVLFLSPSPRLEARLIFSKPVHSFEYVLLDIPPALPWSTTDKCFRTPLLDPLISLSHFHQALSFYSSS